MKIDAGFKLRLHRELERRAEDGSLPEPMKEVLGSQVSALAQPRSFEALDSRGISAAEVRIRTVVNAFESPSLLIQNQSFETPASENWAQILEPRRGAIEQLVPAVGRIEVKHHPNRSWLGTGVLVAPTILVTNRHVARQMAEESPEGWVFAPGAGGQRITSRIDFLQEYAVTATAEFALVDILAVENESGPDLAFLRVEDHTDLPQHAELGGALEPLDAVAVIGYTSKVGGMPAEVEEILEHIFGSIYDVKRLAPGRILSTGGDQVSHDCSTQGGNSGSALVDLESALVSGIHFEGGLTENFAVPAQLVRSRLDALA